MRKRDEIKINGEVPPPETYKDFEKCRDGYTNDFPRFARKQFSLREYLKDPKREVITRCGFPVRILSTDVRSEGERFFVLGLIKLPNGFERIQLWTTEGFCDPNEAEKFDQDLYMRPLEKVGWANIKIEEDNESMSLGRIYQTKRDAVLARQTDRNYATAKVVWYD